MSTLHTHVYTTLHAHVYTTLHAHVYTTLHAHVYRTRILHDLLHNVRHLRVAMFIKKRKSFHNTYLTYGGK